VAEAVKKITGGRGVAVVYDGVGQATFAASLASLAPRGYLVYFGAASGAVPPFDPDLLQSGGSLYLTRPSMAHYTQTREELLRRANEVFGWVAGGSLKVNIGRSFPLSEAAAAHRLVDSRQNVGKLLLEPRQS
jgi:NADPH2:quinone reductase